ncbi:fungal-specific transcription factor domain-containing protein [Colletotrichum navitas]|uniref:Fungal-specific transcription factor domain-containing protein n=1 Tax=Colletotrichum navitas TaxID=681940 RepID=A0AAD8PQH9_9PEZI|nr:fungal-specific transcription factor domain-containing protein [Colletotrichum navitas]KAK1574382.1 fungal-specific transcription factor domain-containing protein [Colletotrichum navitas]
MVLENETSQSLHTCSTCSRSFNRIENLKRHQKTHQSRLPHRCVICQKEFSRSDILKKHRRVHHKGTPDGQNLEENPAREFCFVLEDPGSLSQALPDKIAHPVSLGSSSVTTTSTTSTVTWGPPTNDAQYSTYSHNGGPASGTNSTAANQHHSTIAALPAILDVDVDFSTFFQSWADNLWLDTRQWFTPEFHDAMREKTYMDNPLLQDGSQLFSDQRAWFGDELGLPGHGQDTAVSMPHKGAMAPHEITANIGHENAGPRVSSPPNVPSQEDGVAFGWDPSSKMTQQTQHVPISERHPFLLRQQHQFSMGDSVWASIQEFLKPRIPNSGDFILPSLAVANAFLGLFFEEFYEQSPVLHLPTLNVDSLPPPLIVAMIVIGATYSHIRQSRRFSTLVLDRARQNLQQSIEADKALTRDPHILYAYALLVYMGLWCGNKGAYEAAEASRGALVTYIRRLPPLKPRSLGGNRKVAEDQWEGWIDLEFRYRLRWYVFMIDMQFPAILNLRGMMSLAEVCRWECPSDEQHWTASDAKTWTHLLNAAPQPSTVLFATAYQALLTPDGSSRSTSPSLLRSSAFSSWTLLLVLSSLGSQAYDWSHEWSMNPVDDSESPFNTSSQNRYLGVNRGSSRTERLKTRENIIESVDAWHHRYNAYRGTGRASGPDSYFLRASRILHGLVHIHLHTSISHIQDALGKGGDHAVQEGLSRLQYFFAHGYASHGQTTVKPPPESLHTFAKATENCVSIMSDQGLRSAAPYSIFAVFLSHVFLWAVIKTSSETIKAQVHLFLRDAAPAIKSELEEALDRAISEHNDGARNGDGGRLVLMHGAQSLVRLGTWGAALNLARLLQLRAAT